MTPAGKGNILAALDILVETGSLTKDDCNEAQSAIEQIPENALPLEGSKCTCKIQAKQGKQKNAK